jgi:hypothetical protein
MNCALDCKYGFERDASDCELCSCNRCPLYTCRMFCMYGFKKNQDGCDVCECDWSPVSENIQCSEVRKSKIFYFNYLIFNREFHVREIVYVI